MTNSKSSIAIRTKKGDKKMAKTYKVEDSVEVPSGMLSNPPFAKINVWKEPKGTHIRWYINIGELAIEGATTGVAIDGSGSMQANFGFGPFGARNVVKEVGQVLCSYIAKADKDKGTTLIYWATADPGEIEPHGFLTEAEAASYPFLKPKNYGRVTNMMPVLKYFIEGTNPKTGSPFKDEKFGIFIILTDGFIDDFEDVKNYSIQLAQDVEAGKFNEGVKLVIIGVGKEIDQNQMQELDDLDTGDVDLYFSLIAEEMSDLAEIYTELVSEDLIVAPSGVVRDEKGKEIVNFRDTGVPGFCEFDLPAKATSFTLEVEGQTYTQPLP